MEEVAVKKRGRPAKTPGGGKSSTVAVAAASPGIKKRGRPAKNKGSSGGGGQRGRPPKASKIQNDEDPEDEGEEEGEGDGSGAELANNSSPLPTKGRGRPKSSGGAGPGSGDSVKTPGSAKKRKAGRPKKHQPSDSENEDEQDEDDDGNSSIEERRPVGRPSAGSVNLNISRTGRGLGRPKKRAVESNGDGEPQVPKKRGRPPQNKSGSGGSTGYVPTGRPRGRPKANAAPVEKHEDNDDDQDDNSGEEEHSSPEKTVVMPKKRGRPSLGAGKVTKEETSKPRGRPAKNIDDDADDADSADQDERNSKKEANDEDRAEDGTPTKGVGLKWNSDGENDANDGYVSDNYNDSESVA
ncbi:chromosomal protein D1 [Drosophila sechellia]|uniref:GM26279 n=1 Tax=Drosophila sechellia TaxID=7238 RepID=B4HKH3_DROSE|nr:chromosomal protein D1 [Drosophila sechellia]XP_032576847.1 chromosomal protein D1 [Drosophila sechellia]EDW42923.1 GM26279 [Drosophila sechellia]